jgi:hypothetical protein
MRSYPVYRCVSILNPRIRRDSRMARWWQQTSRELRQVPLITLRPDYPFPISHWDNYLILTPSGCVSEEPAVRLGRYPVRRKGVIQERYRGTPGVN